jgi:hypothetical protein
VAHGAERDVSDETGAANEASEPSPSEPPLPAQRAGTPRPRRSNTLALLVAVVAVLVIGGSALLIWRWFTPGRPAASTTPGVQTPSADPAVASAQARAVGDLLGAWVADDTAAIENLVTAQSLPWSVPPPPLPGNVPRGLVGAVAKPRLEGDTWVIGDQASVFVRLTGDGISPKGLVTAQLTVANATSRRVDVGVVQEGGAWKIDTVNGLPAAQGLQTLLR